MSDLIERLNAAIDEDEQIAKAAGSDEWRAYKKPFPEKESGTRAILIDDPYGWLDDEYAAHVIRHDPKQTLRQVDAYRQILALHKIQIQDRYPGQSGPDQYACGSCDRHEHDGGLVYGPEPACPTVLALAAIYDITPE